MTIAEEKRNDTVDFSEMKVGEVGVITHWAEQPGNNNERLGHIVLCCGSATNPAIRHIVDLNDPTAVYSGPFTKSNYTRIRLLKSESHVDLKVR